MDFIERLKQLIDNKEFTKTSLHKKIGVSRETLDNYLKGKTSPTTEDVKKMSKILGESFGKETPRTFRDEIFEGDYIGMHKRVWDRLEKTMDRLEKSLDGDQEVIKTLTAIINETKLTRQ